MNETDSVSIFILVAFLSAGLGALIMYLLRKKKSSAKVEITKDSSVLLERIEKVFKVVMAEGYFTEIYNYQNAKDFWQLFKDRKKALLIAKAKVLVGYDFSKMRLTIDNESNKLIVEYFPEPEILSIDTDYKFYDIEQGWINRFRTDDYTAILTEAKQAMSVKAMESDLPRIATNQLQFMMIQLADGMNWKLEMRLPEANRKMLDSYTEYSSVSAKVNPLSSNT